MLPGKLPPLQRANWHRWAKCMTEFNSASVDTVGVINALNFYPAPHTCNVHQKRTATARSRHHKMMAPVEKKNFIGVLWILSRSAIKAMGLTAGRFKRGALRGYYLTCGWYLNKTHVLHNREGYISVLTRTASWHGLRPEQWIKTSSRIIFIRKEIKERTSCALPQMSQVEVV